MVPRLKKLVEVVFFELLVISSKVISQVESRCVALFDQVNGTISSLGEVA